jgi:hypothetical protein
VGDVTLVRERLEVEPRGSLSAVEPSRSPSALDVRGFDTSSTCDRKRRANAPRRSDSAGAVQWGTRNLLNNPRVSTGTRELK